MQPGSLMPRIYIVEQNALSIGGHYFGYSACVAQAARRASFEVVLLTNTRLLERFPEEEGVRILPVFTLSWGEAERDGTVAWKPGNLAYEMVEALGPLPPSAEDHVLIHTLGCIELLAILGHLVSQTPIVEIPHYHILLRFDPAVLGSGLGLCALYFRQIAASAFLSRRIHFHADTSSLSREYERLAGVPVATAPIPVVQRPPDSAAQQPRRDANAPLKAVYLGDARVEKGYRHLPRAVSYLWREYLATKRLEFTIQSNFNMPGGEPGILQACQELTAMPGSAVKLLHDPLSAEEYNAIINACDIVVVPYAPGPYQLRSSGVLVEALAFGKVVVTSSGSWMATQVTGDHAVLVSDPDELGPAIAEAVERFDDLSAGALARQEYWRLWSSGDHFIRHLLDVAEASSPKLSERDPRVLVVLDDTAMRLNGDFSHIAHARLRYLSEAGYRIVCLFVSHELPACEASDESRLSALLGEVQRYPLERIFVAGPGRWIDDTDRLLSVQAQGRERPVRSDFDAGGRFEFNAGIDKYLRNNTIDAVLASGIRNLRVLEALGLTQTPLICEVWGLQSFQNAVDGRTVVDERQLDEELAALAQCDVLLSTNERDTGYLRARLPRTQIATSGVFFGPPVSSVVSLAGANNIAEIIASCRPANPDYPLGDSSNTEKSDELYRLLGLDAIDLCFVGGGRENDIAGLRWFLDEVYLPHLQGRGLSMVVAGAVCGVTRWPKGPRLFFVDRVDNPGPLYAATRVVVLPVLHDTGGPVRVLEALRHSRPVIATTAAIRGIESQVEGMLIRDDAASFATAILELISSPAERSKYAELSKALYLRLCDPVVDVQTLNDVFATVLGERARPAPPVCWPPSRAARPIEWSPLMRALNHLVRAVI